MEFNLKLQGYTNEAQISQEDFLEQFTAWVDSKGWGFTGKVTELTDDEDVEGYIEQLASNPDGIFSVYDDGEDTDEEEA